MTEWGIAAGFQTHLNDFERVICVNMGTIDAAVEHLEIALILID